MFERLNIDLQNDDVSMFRDDVPDNLVGVNTIDRDGIPGLQSNSTITPGLLDPETDLSVLEANSHSVQDIPIRKRREIAAEPLNVPWHRLKQMNLIFCVPR